MSNLTDLVPPLKLCKLIPQGEFESSALGYHRYCIKDGKEYYEVVQRGNTHSLTDVQYPAPTLEEILQELVNLSVRRLNVCKSWGEWHIDCYDNERLIEKDSVKKITTAALKLWLKMKGIEA